MQARVIHDRYGWAVDFNGFRSAMPDEATAKLMAQAGEMADILREMQNVLYFADPEEEHPCCNRLKDRAEKVLTALALTKQD